METNCPAAADGCCTCQEEDLGLSQNQEIPLEDIDFNPSKKKKYFAISSDRDVNDKNPIIVYAGSIEEAMSEAYNRFEGVGEQVITVTNKRFENHLSVFFKLEKSLDGKSEKYTWEPVGGNPPDAITKINLGRLEKSKKSLKKLEIKKEFQRIFGVQYPIYQIVNIDENKIYNLIYRKQDEWVFQEGSFPYLIGMIKILNLLRKVPIYCLFDGITPIFNGRFSSKIARDIGEGNLDCLNCSRLFLKKKIPSIPSRLLLFKTGYF
jgi:hypothetical protein